MLAGFRTMRWTNWPGFEPCQRFEIQDAAVAGLERAVDLCPLIQDQSRFCFSGANL